MEYFEQGGGATAKLLWESASQTTEIIPAKSLVPAAPVTGQGLKAEYFVGVNLDTLKHVRLDPTIDFDWQDGSPTMGEFQAQISTALAYNLAYTLDPVEVTIQVMKGDPAKATYHVYDIYKNEHAKGRLTGSTTTFTFNPPRYGWYMIQCLAKEGDAIFLSVTPEFEGAHTLMPGESRDGWNDEALHAFTGLMMDRTNTRMGLDYDLKVLVEAEKYGVTLVVQFESAPTEEHVREAVTKLKGKVKYYELVNEPNFSMGPAQYADLTKKIVPLIKEIDPEAYVMGPDTCGIFLGWHEELYRLGALQLFDGVSTHTYERHLNADHFHLRWKLGELRKIMARYGDAEKDLWQTEAIVTGMMAGCFLGPQQAVRLTMQRDMLQLFGIHNDRNSVYNMNLTGFLDTFVRSNSGLHPPALTARTRHALTSGLGRRFKREVDFGPTGNKALLGMPYEGEDGATLMLRNYGCLDMPLELKATGNELEMVDSFGNVEKVAVRNGKARVTAGILPVYLLLEKGQQFTPPNIDFGRNMAKEATFKYSGPDPTDYKVLTDGLFQATDLLESPWGMPWQGGYAGKVFDEKPETLDMTFPEPCEIGGVAIYGVRASNPYCALLDYDLEYRRDGQWVTLEQVRTPCALSCGG
jgi:hypothetical protein